MEGPSFFGWLFGKPSTEPTPETAQISVETVQPQPFERPGVDIDQVALKLERYRSGLIDDSRKRSEARVKEWLHIPPAEALKKLLEGFDPQYPNLGKFKYVRQGDNIIVGFDGPPHTAYAVLSGLVPEEAGYLKVNPDHQDTVIVYGDSVGLDIKNGNKNRPGTMELLRKVAPNMNFEEELPKPPTPRPRPSAKL